MQQWLKCFSHTSENNTKYTKNFKTYLLGIWGNVIQHWSMMSKKTHTVRAKISIPSWPRQSPTGQHTNTIVKEFGTRAKTSHETLSYTLSPVSHPTYNWNLMLGYKLCHFKLLSISHKEKNYLIKDFKLQSTCTLRLFFFFLKDRLSRGDREGCMKSKKFLFTCHSLFCQTS